MPARGQLLPEALFTVRKVAHYLEVAERMLYSMLQDGKLPALKVGNSWRLQREGL